MTGHHSPSRSVRNHIRVAAGARPPEATRQEIPVGQNENRWTQYVAGDLLSEDHSIGVVFIMKSGDRLQIIEQPTWTSASKLDNVKKIEEMFETVSRKTWDNRVNRYTTHVSELVYFDYSGCRFYPKEQQIVDVEKSQTYQISETSFSKSYGFIALNKKDEGIGRKLLRKLATSQRGINTLQDTDVIIFLLKHCH